MDTRVSHSKHRKKEKTKIILYYFVYKLSANKAQSIGNKDLNTMVELGPLY